MSIGMMNCYCPSANFCKPGEALNCKRYWNVTFVLKNGEIVNDKMGFWADIFTGTNRERGWLDMLETVIISGKGKIFTPAKTKGRPYEVIFLENENSLQKLTKDQKAKVMAALI